MYSSASPLMDHGMEAFSDLEFVWFALDPPEPGQDANLTKLSWWKHVALHTNVHMHSKQARFYNGTEQHAGCQVREV